MTEPSIWCQNFWKISEIETGGKLIAVRTGKMLLRSLDLETWDNFSAVIDNKCLMVSYKPVYFYH